MNYLIKLFIFIIIGFTVSTQVTAGSFESHQDHAVVTSSFETSQSFPTFENVFGDIDNNGIEELTEPLLSSELFIITLIKPKFESANILYQQIYPSIESPPFIA